MQAIINRADFLSSFSALKESYRDYCRSFDALYSQHNWEKLDSLAGQIGESQKKLSTFGLQVLCHPVPHYPLPDFTKEPDRSCKLWFGETLELDYLGGPKGGFAVMKGDFTCAVLARVSSQGHPLRARRAIFDLDAIGCLCEVIKSALNKTMKELLKDAPDTAKKQDAVQSTPAVVNADHVSGTMCGLGYPKI